MLKLSTKLALAAAAILTLTSGCAHNTDPKLDAGFFKAEDEARSPKTFADAQAAAGARDDGMLFARDFDGSQLNSLGRSKLELMARHDDSTQPVTVRVMATGDDKVASARKEAISNYLKDCGLTDDQIKLVDGAGDATYHPAAQDLAAMKKTDTAKENSGDTNDAGSILAPSK